MKLKLYLDTSVISAYFDSRNPERQQLTQEFFAQAEQFEVYVSEITLLEIDQNPNETRRVSMQQLVASFEVLTLSDEVEKVTQSLIQYGAVPPGSNEDAYHLAIAIVAGMDYVLSWNFRHLVRLKTRDIVRLVTTLQHYRSVNIVTPAEVI